MSVVEFYTVHISLFLEFKQLHLLRSRPNSVKTSFPTCSNRRGDTSLAFGFHAEAQVATARQTYYSTAMKSSTVTIRVDAKLDRELKRLSRSLGQTKSDIARDALKRQVALLRFRKTRQAVLSEIEAKTGVLTDEDVFAIVSLGSSSIRTYSSVHMLPV